MGIWQDMKDRIAGRHTAAEVASMEPRGESEERYAQQERDALRYRSRHNDYTEMRADGMSYEEVYRTFRRDASMDRTDRQRQAQQHIAYTIQRGREIREGQEEQKERAPERTDPVIGSISGVKQGKSQEDPEQRQERGR